MNGAGGNGSWGEAPSVFGAVILGRPPDEGPLCQCIGKRSDFYFIILSDMSVWLVGSGRDLQWKGCCVWCLSVGKKEGDILNGKGDGYRRAG